jgi:NAD(P)-dependent dehydrogenase (short-subunit alcohol dehydrogenase family)
MNKPILITGASSGVGLSLVKYLSGRYHVIAIVRNLSKLEKALGDLSCISAYQADLADYGEVKETVGAIREKHGYIPYLINNAGVNIGGFVEALRYEQVFESLQVNAISPFLTLREFLPEMKVRNFGRIINITSGAPFNCFPGFGAYSASKAALNAFTVTAARECFDFNIKINLMSPGPVRSQMAPNALMDPSVCHPTADYLLSLDESGPSGRFFWLGYEIPLFPDLKGVNWLEGIADKKFRKVVP